MDRARRYGAVRLGVVLGGGDGNHGVAVAVALLEDVACYLGPAGDAA